MSSTSKLESHSYYMYIFFNLENQSKYYTILVKNQDVQIILL